MNIRSRPTFLIRRLTIAHFHLSEKEPEDKDKLMILVITGSCRSFSQSIQSTWPHNSQTVGENRSTMVNRCGQLLLDEGQADNPEAMLSGFTWMLTVFSIK